MKMDQQRIRQWAQHVDNIVEQRLHFLEKNLPCEPENGLLYE